MCIKQAGVETNKIEAAKKGQFADDPKLKDYLVCIAKSIGFVDDAGALQHLVIKSKIGSVLENQDVAAKVDAECAVEKGILQETVFELAKCLYEKKPKYLEFS